MKLQQIFIIFTLTIFFISCESEKDKSRKRFIAAQKKIEQMNKNPITSFKSFISKQSFWGSVGHYNNLPKFIFNNINVYEKNLNEAIDTGIYFQINSTYTKLTNTGILYIKPLFIIYSKNIMLPLTKKELIIKWCIKNNLLYMANFSQTNQLQNINFKFTGLKEITMSDYIIEKIFIDKVFLNDCKLTNTF